MAPAFLLKNNNNKLLTVNLHSYLSMCLKVTWVIFMRELGILNSLWIMPNAQNILFSLTWCLLPDGRNVYWYLSGCNGHISQLCLVLLQFLQQRPVWWIELQIGGCTFSGEGPIPSWEREDGLKLQWLRLPFHPCSTPLLSWARSHSAQDPLLTSFIGKLQQIKMRRDEVFCGRHPPGLGGNVKDTLLPAL